MSLQFKKASVIVMGALPPPYMGPTIATEIILNSKLKKRHDLIHLDTSDHRGLNTLNKVDFRNIILAFKHYLLLFKIVFYNSPKLIYMPVCQTTLGYFRDAPFIIMAKLFGLKVLCHLRGGNFKNWYLSASPLTRSLVRRVHSLINGQIVLGESLRSLFKGILPDEKIFVVPNGANIFFEMDKKAISNNEKIRILFLSNIIKEKGFLDVLKAVPEVVQFCANSEFVFSGYWMNDEAKNAFNEFRNRNPELPIVLLGPVSGSLKFDLLAKSDIFVLPTYYPPEGLPWVIIEAMAAGLPIITTDQGAITESVKDGINGFIVEKRNPQQIADRIRFLIENPEIRKKMGEESRRIYLENFTEEKMIERLSAVFHAVLSNSCAE